MGGRNPSKDAVAIVGVGSAGYTRDAQASVRSLALEACVGAMRDAGLVAADVDGICGTTHSIAPQEVLAGLGIPRIGWHEHLVVPFTSHVIAATHAVYAGICDTALVYHATYRAAGTSRSARHDPLRDRFGTRGVVPNPDPDSLAGTPGYAAWADWYLRRYGWGREDLALVALNGRANAMANPTAAIRSPLSLDDYLAAPMIREPLCLYDMDYPVDAADAPGDHDGRTGSRSRRHAGSGPCREPRDHEPACGGPDDRPRAHGASGWSWSSSGNAATSPSPTSTSSIPTTASPTSRCHGSREAGWCAPGEAPAFLRDSWDDASGRVLVGGRVPFNSHGGSLSDGGTQAAGHVRESVRQLRGEAGDRQVLDAAVALLCLGGFFRNAGGLVLRRA